MYETDDVNNLMPSANAAAQHDQNPTYNCNSVSTVLSLLAFLFSTFQRQGEEDGSGGEVHLLDGPPHPQHQGRPLNTGPWQLCMNSQRLIREHVNFDCCPLSL